ncbi:MAG: SDR family oxidoreductase [Chitinophagales bacterium]
MKILIIGSKGFIGAHTIQYFLDKNDIVFGCDVLVDYNASNYFILDSTNANFHEIFESQTFDVCINCSGASSVPDSFVHPHRDFELNVNNVVKIVDAIRKHQPTCKLINISSAAVYGNPIHLPISESVPKSPISPYGSHKLMAENILKEYYTHYQIQSISVRPFSVFGPGLKKQLFWDIYHKMTKQNQIELFGTGNETRDFIFIKDVVRTFDFIIQNSLFNAESINIANGEEITIKEAVETFANCMEWKGTINFNNQQRIGDPLNWKADISKIQSYGYKPQYSLLQGLTEYKTWLVEKT